MSPRHERIALRRALGGFLLLRRAGAIGADAARDLGALDAAVGRGVVFGEGVRRAGAGGEEGRGRAVVLLRGAVDADVVVAGGVAFDALVEELDVASCDCVAAD